LKISEALKIEDFRFQIEVQNQTTKAALVQPRSWFLPFNLQSEIFNLKS